MYRFEMKKEQYDTVVKLDKWLIDAPEGVSQDVRDAVLDQSIKLVKRGVDEELSVLTVWYDDEKLFAEVDEPCSGEQDEPEDGRIVVELVRCEGKYTNIPSLLNTLKRAEMWIANGGHLNSVLPNDAVRTLQLIEVQIKQLEK